MSFIKICQICGKEFEARRRDQKYCKGPHFYKCKICGKEFEFNGNPHDVPNTCSKECKQKYKEQCLQEKYGPGIKSVSQIPEVREKKKISNASKEAQDKMKKTNLERYGTEYACQNEEVRKKISKAQKSEEVQAKKKNTYQERYGVDNLLADPNFRKKYGCNHVGDRPEVKEKVQKTLHEKYGENITSTSQVPEFKEKAKKTRKETMQNRYGADTLFSTDMFKEYIKEIYGVENVAQSKEIKELKEKNSLEKYGVPYPSKSPEVQKKISNTTSGKEYQEARKKSSLEKYGTECPLQNEEVKQKIKETNLDRYGYEYATQNSKIKEKVQQTNMEKFGVPWACMRENYRNYRSISKVNKSFAELLDKNNIEYQFEFPIENYSFDFKIENSNILIEIDPTITHNSYISIFDKDSKGKDPNYHLNKSNIAKKYGYYCINVFDWDEWNKVLQLVQSKEHISIKDCDIKVVDNSIAEMFEDKNYINGSCKNQTLCYGLYYKNELICLMSFSELKDSDFQWKLICMCTKNDISVDEGYLKLFNRFINDNNPESVISYCDNSKFNGKQFTDLKMKFYKTIEPIKYWSKDSQHISDDFLNNYGYKNLFEEVSEKDKEYTNEELMLLDNWLPVYDCGQNIYTWTKS